MMELVGALLAVLYLLADRWLSLPAAERAQRREQLAGVFGGGRRPRADP